MLDAQANKSKLLPPKLLRPCGAGMNQELGLAILIGVVIPSGELGLITLIGPLEVIIPTGVLAVGMLIGVLEVLTSIPNTPVGVVAAVMEAVDLDARATKGVAEPDQILMIMVLSLH